jgi:transcription initiation factor TFIIB
MEKLQLKMRAPSVADRNLGKAMTEIDRISGGLGLPKSVKETAALIYRKASKIKIIRGRSISLIAAASIYAACRQVNLPKTLKMVENASGIGKGEIARAYRLLVRMLDLKMPVATPAQFIPKIVESLEIPWVVQVVALKVLREVRETFISAGNDPRTLAAAAIYMASRITGFRVRQSDVAAAAGITEISIRNCCRRLSTLAAAMIEKQELSIRSRPSL